jgi:uncharacterized membrane protein
MAAVIAIAAGACEPEQSYEKAQCATGTELTWENFGKTFMLRYCNQCHTEGLEDRHGAPEGFDFQELRDVRKHASHIYDRSAGENASMPPGPDDPPIDERDDLAEWLACGAPSEEDTSTGSP